MNLVKRTERGWAGHFIMGSQCLFHRNTLLECGDVKIVVSTVGNLPCPMEIPKTLGNSDMFQQGMMAIGLSTYYETMAFHSNPKDTKYHDIEVSREVRFNSPWKLDAPNQDDKANLMHEEVVTELVGRLINGEKL